MTPSFSLPPSTALLRDVAERWSETAEQIEELGRLATEHGNLSGTLSGLLRDINLRLVREGESLDELEILYEQFCEAADAGLEVDDILRRTWRLAVDILDTHLDQLARWNHPLLRAHLRDAGRILKQHADRLADLVRTIAVVWGDELDLETPDEIADVLWTVRVSPVAYLRAMGNLFWSCVRHPLTETTIELLTGRVLATR